MAKCNYKNSLRGCVGNGIVENVVIVHYNLREYENLQLCEGCSEKIMLEVLDDLQKPQNKELSLYIFDLDYNLVVTVNIGDDEDAVHS